MFFLFLFAIGQDLFWRQTMVNIFTPDDQRNRVHPVFTHYLAERSLLRHRTKLLAWVWQGCKRENQKGYFPLRINPSLSVSVVPRRKKKIKTVNHRHSNNTELERNEVKRQMFDFDRKRWMDVGPHRISNSTDGSYSGRLTMVRDSLRRLSSFWPFFPSTYQR